MTFEKFFEGDTARYLDDLEMKFNSCSFKPSHFVLFSSNRVNFKLFASIDEQGGPLRLLSSVKIYSDMHLNAYVAANSVKHFSRVKRNPRKLIYFSDFLNLLSCVNSTDEDMLKL